MVTVEDYEAFYRIWLPIEVSRGMGGVEEARKRAHQWALDDCGELLSRQVAAGVYLDRLSREAVRAPKNPPAAPPQAGGTPPAPPQAGGNARSSNGAKRRGA